MSLIPSSDPRAAADAAALERFGPPPLATPAPQWPDQPFDPWLVARAAGGDADRAGGDEDTVVWRPGQGAKSQTLWQDATLSEWEAEPAVGSGIFPLESFGQDDDTLQLGVPLGSIGSGTHGRDCRAAADNRGARALDMAPGRLGQYTGGSDRNPTSWVPWSMPQPPMEPEPPTAAGKRPPAGFVSTSTLQTQSQPEGQPESVASLRQQQHEYLGGADWFATLHQDQRPPEEHGRATDRWRPTAGEEQLGQQQQQDAAARSNSDYTQQPQFSAAQMPWSPQEEGAWALDELPSERQHVRKVLTPGKPKDIPIKFDFFKESASVAAMDADEVAAFRASKRIQTSNGCPRPAVSFADAGFPSDIADALQAAGFPDPTSIQCQGWPLALRGKDMVGIAATGSGKTLAFMLPALVHAQAQPTPSAPGEAGEGPIVLVLAPTRELACQIRDECTTFAKRSSVNCVCVYGGASRRDQVHEVQVLRPHAVIATPGRLLDLLQAGVTTLARVTFLVLDEADRMLDMGFKHHLDSIMSQVRSEHQTIMTSATWPKDMVCFAKNYLRANHEEIHIGQTGTASKDIEQRVIACRADQKETMLEKTLNEIVQPGRKVLVFVRTKRRTEEVARAMRRAGFDAETMHADRSQQERDAVIARFKRESTMLLFATDVAQRGLDIKGVTHVVNFDLPDRLDDYIHRIGRTGRAGAKGSAVSLCSDGDTLLPALVELLDTAELTVPTEMRAMAAACFGGSYARDGDGYGGSEHAVNLDDLKTELGQLAKVQTHAGGGPNSERGGNGGVRMLVSNLPATVGQLQDVQKFIFEKELRKLFAFCGPIAAIGFDTTTTAVAEGQFTGTSMVDFQTPSDAAYAVRMYDGYSMTSGNPLGPRLHCNLAGAPAPAPAPTLGHAVPPLQQYLQVGLAASTGDVSKSTCADPSNPIPESECARMKSLWHELTDAEQNAAESLGWSGATWEAGAGPTAGAQGWQTMRILEQMAAAALGYGQQSWDSESGLV